MIYVVQTLIPLTTRYFKFKFPLLSHFILISPLKNPQEISFLDQILENKLRGQRIKFLNKKSSPKNFASKILFPLRQINIPYNID